MTAVGGEVPWRLLTDGAAGAGPAPGVQPEDRVLLILAADHRNSLERELYGLTAGQPDPEFW